MNISELKTYLQKRPDLPLAIAMPDGRRVPAHYHVTEVGHVAKRFVDCGGKFRAVETCVLQTHVGSPRDDGHRLTAGKLAQILGLGAPILPAGDVPVEVEYEDRVISQYPITGAGLVDDVLTLQLGGKHTDCLAKEKCGVEERCGCADDAVGGAREPEGCCAAPAGSKACC